MSARIRKIVLFTSQDIGFSLVEMLAKRPNLSLFVVADRTIRDDTYGYRSAIDACHTLGIAHVKASRVDETVKARIHEFAPDIVVSAYFPHIIPDDVIKEPPLGSINVHPGMLPLYRGKFPTPWYILNGEEYFGIAIHRIDSGIDTGDVFVQRQYPLPPAITGHELYRQTMIEGAALLAEHLDSILDGSITAHPQEGTGSYYSTIEKRYHLDWNLSAAMIERRVRVHAKPFLPAFSYLFNRIIFINRAVKVELESYTAQGGGRILQVDASGHFIVSCADGCLLIEEHDFYPPLSAEERATHLRAGNRLE
jgi:methionyl-tRNA formyltransferase